MRRKGKKKKIMDLKRITVADEEHFLALPEKKPPCSDDSPHFFDVPPSNGQYMLGTCRRCRIKWIFKTEIDDVWRGTLRKFT